MHLGELLCALDGHTDDEVPTSLAITTVCESLNDVQEGSLFVCVRGTRTDGHDLAAQAVDRGAVAIVAERETGVRVPQFIVADSRVALARLAAQFFGNPAQSLTLVGVTGTNGKTTTSQILSDVLTSSGRHARVIGTLTSRYTSPPPLHLHRELRRFVDEGAEIVVMEVSSHALSQHRVDGLHFACVAFTNLSQDHLDYHLDMEDYFLAKASLFTKAFADHAVINVDDAAGERLCAMTELPVTSVSRKLATNEHVDHLGTAFDWREQHVALPLYGHFNVMNALCAAELARVFGIPLRDVADGLSTIAQIPGRFERVDVGQPFTAIVDFAHTPDGLAQALDAARSSLTPHARLICVFGCGGDRDHDKRPKMAAAATARADVVVVTSDNPRSEDPQSIIDDIMFGRSPSPSLLIEPDRERAIAGAIQLARAGDCVLVAGKGHETTQEINGKRHEFDDRIVTRAAIETWAQGDESEIGPTIKGSSS